MRENEALKEMKGYVSSLPARLGQKQTGDSMAGRPIRRSLLESESIAPTDAVRWPVTHEVRISPSYRQAQSDWAGGPRTDDGDDESNFNPGPA